MKTFFTKLAFLSVILFAQWAFAEPFYQAQTPVNSGRSYESYLGSLGAPAITRGQDCKRVDGKERCIPNVTLGNEKFSGFAEITTRYQDITYALIPAGKGYRRVDSRGGDTYIRASTPDGMKFLSLFMESDYPYALITRNGNFLYMKDDKVMHNSEVMHTLAGKPLFHVFGSSPQGQWAMAYIGKDYGTYLVNQNGIVDLGSPLNYNSDINYTMSVFPVSKNEYWVALYEYRNKRNKSLWLHHVKNNKVTKHLLTNTIQNDLGVKPQLYMNRQGELVVSTDPLDGKLYYQIHPRTLARQEAPQNPYMKTDFADFMISGGTRYTMWYVDQTVEGPKDSNGDRKKFASMDYQLNNSLLHEVRLTGQVWGNQLVLGYLKNSAQSGLNRYEKMASERIYGMLGIRGIFKGASALRLEFQQETVGGLATYKPESGGPEESAEFENDYRRYSLVRTTELGFHYGLHYTENNLPSVVGFFDSVQGTPKVYFDPDFELKKYGISIGFDSGQYASRYMFNDSRYYLDARFTLNLVDIGISKEVKEKAKNDFPGKKIETSMAFGGDLFLEAGYLWQVRSVKAAGLGISFQTGISADIEFFMDSLSEDSKIAEDKVVSSMERIDLRWGPFARLNLLF